MANKEDKIMINPVVVAQTSGVISDLSALANSTNPVLIYFVNSSFGMSEGFLLINLIVLNSDIY